MGNSIFIVSGEESGDQHGASLMAALCKRMPGVSFSGMGGERMRGAGLKGLDSRKISVVGVAEVIEKLPGILKAFGGLKKLLAGGTFDAVVLIDFPDFNIRFAKEAKKLGIPVIYYISPQVWAWRKGRVKKIAGLVDKMLVVFPFEVQLYRDFGVDVEYVGHPLGDIECAMTKDEASASLGLPPSARVISILPGSRTGEVKRLLPTMLAAAKIIEKGLKKKTVILLPAAASVEGALIDGFLKGSSLDVRVLRGNLYAALRASDAAVVASGTATLEVALIGTPMVIVYRLSPVSYGIARVLVGVDHIGLPNIVAGRGVVPELIQGGVSPENIAEEVLSILREDKKREAMIGSYKEIKDSLGKGGAASKAAEAIARVIEGRGRLKGA